MTKYTYDNIIINQRNMQKYLCTARMETHWLQADTGEWGKQRTYKGYTLKDWKVYVENNFDHTNLNAAGKLKKEIFV